MATTTITGSGGNDTIIGGNQSQTIDGGAGNDTIIGGNGGDTIDGGSGSDIMRGGNGKDTFIESINENYLSVDIIDGGNGKDTLILKGTAHQFQLLAQAITDWQASDKSKVFHFGTYGSGILNLDIVNVEYLQLVTLANSGPIAVNDTASVSESIAPNAAVDLIGNVLCNDRDPDAGDVITVTSVAPMVGTYGTLVMQANGSYAYSFNNTTSEALTQGQVVHEIFTYSISDGQGGTATATLNITVTGTNDIAVISGADVSGNVKEDTKVSASGHLTVSDVDTGEAFFTPSLQNGAYGNFTMDANGNWLYTLNNTSLIVQALAEGEQHVEIFRVYSKDHSAFQDIAVTVVGKNDIAVISGNAAGNVREDTTVSATGTLAVADVDTGQAFFVPVASQSGAYGNFTMDASGQWTYALRNGDANVQALREGETHQDTFTVQSLDGSASQNVVVTVVGKNDIAVISGNATGNVREDTTLGAAGKLNVADVDTGQAFFVPVASQSGAYGNFTMDASGQWAYALRNGDANVQALAEGETHQDTFTVQSLDGSASRNVVVTVVGKNDIAVISGNAAGNVREDTTLSATGALAVADVDTGQAFFVPVASQSGAYGNFTMDASGQWAYALRNGDANVQALREGETYQDTFTVQSLDGSASQNVVVTVVGKNDAPVSQAAAFSVNEDALLSNHVMATDVDAGSALTYALVGAAPAGLTFNPDGTFSFNAGNAAYQSLAAGTQQDYTFQYKANDGLVDSNTSTVTVTVTGINHAPVATVASLNNMFSNMAPYFLDPDSGDTLTYTLMNAPAGVSLDSSTGTFIFAPNQDSYSIDGASIKATDNHGVDSATIMLNGLVFNAPETPAGNGNIQTLSVNANAATTFDLYLGRFLDLTQLDAFIDISTSLQNSLTYSATLVGGAPLPTGITLDSHGILFVTNTAALGTDHIALTATDSLGSMATDNLTINIVDPLSSFSPALDFGTQVPIQLGYTTSLNAISSRTGIQSAVFSGLNAFDFTLGSPVTSSSDGSLVYSIFFSPSNPGVSESASVLVTDVLGNTETISLSGTGVVPADYVFSSLNNQTIVLQPTVNSIVGLSGNNNVIDASNLDLTIYGGNPRLQLLSMFPNAPVITVSSESLNFGRGVEGTTHGLSEHVSVNQPSRLFYSITGTDALDFTTNITTGFPTDPLLVSLTPTHVGMETATLRIFAASLTGNYTIATVPLSGTGVAPTTSGLLNSSLVNFGDQKLNITSSPKTETVLLSAGDSISSISITGPNASYFHATLGPTTIAGRQYVNITFDPLTTGTKSAHLTINEAHGTSQSVDLTGRGIGSFAFADKALNFGYFEKGGMTKSFIAYVNVGPGEIISSMQFTQNSANVYAINGVLANNTTWGADFTAHVLSAPPPGQAGVEAIQITFHPTFDYWNIQSRVILSGAVMQSFVGSDGKTYHYIDPFGHYYYNYTAPNVTARESNTLVLTDQFGKTQSLALSGWVVNPQHISVDRAQAGHSIGFTDPAVVLTSDVDSLSIILPASYNILTSNNHTINHTLYEAPDLINSLGNVVSITLTENVQGYQTYSFDLSSSHFSPLVITNLAPTDTIQFHNWSSLPLTTLANLTTVVDDGTGHAMIEILDTSAMVIGTIDLQNVPYTVGNSLLSDYSTFVMMGFAPQINTSAIPTPSALGASAANLFTAYNDDQLVYKLTAVDVSNNQAALNFSIDANGNITGTPTANDIGGVTFTVTAIDPLQGYAYNEYTFTLGHVATFTAPSLINLGSSQVGDMAIGATTSTTLNFTLGDIINPTINITGANAGDFNATLLPVAFSGEQELQVTFKASVAGDETATLTLYDNMGNIQTVTLTGNGVNDAPVATYTSETGFLFSDTDLSGNFLDVNGGYGDVLSYSLLNAPVGLSIDPNMGTLSYSFAPDQHYEMLNGVSVEATGLGGLSATIPLNIIFDSAYYTDPIQFTSADGATLDASATQTNQVMIAQGHSETLIGGSGNDFLFIKTGISLLEAENFDSRGPNIWRGPNIGNANWVIVSDGTTVPTEINPASAPGSSTLLPTASGGAYMQFLPDSGTAGAGSSGYTISPYNNPIFGDGTGNAGVLSYQVHVTDPGTYQLYLRSVGFDGGSDSIYARIEELRDGSAGAADWYDVTTKLPFGSFSAFGSNSDNHWSVNGIVESTALVGTKVPMTWDITQNEIDQNGGNFTIQLAFREDGNAIDALAFQPLVQGNNTLMGGGGNDTLMDTAIPSPFASYLVGGSMGYEVYDYTSGSFSTMPLTATTQNPALTLVGSVATGTPIDFTHAENLALNFPGTFPNAASLDTYAERLTGQFNITTAGTYTFYTTSDDGSQLFIDGALVVNNDGLHSLQTKIGSVSLTEGLHTVVATFYEQSTSQLMDFGLINNTLIGGDGNDLLIGSMSDVLIGDGDPVTALSGDIHSGNNTLQGGSGSTVMYGNEADMSLFNNFLAGSSSNHLYLGNNTLVSGTGNDVMWGVGQNIGTLSAAHPGQVILGNNTFAFDLTHNNGHDFIMDFNKATDSLDFHGVAHVGSNTAVQDVNLNVSSFSGHTSNGVAHLQVNFTDGGSVVFNNIAANSLTTAQLSAHDISVLVNNVSQIHASIL